VSAIMHFRVFLEAMKLARAMPHDDLGIVISKPDVADRKADQAWRRTCERNGIDTSPAGVKTGDPARYVRDYYVGQRLEVAKAKIEQLESELRTLRTQLALLKVTNR
jgi:hypothetical protein